jgi:hypothetical protein
VPTQQETGKGLILGASTWLKGMRHHKTQLSQPEQSLLPPPHLQRLLTLVRHSATDDVQMKHAGLLCWRQCSQLHHRICSYLTRSRSSHVDLSRASVKKGPVNCHTIGQGQALLLLQNPYQCSSQCTYLYTLCR